MSIEITYSGGSMDGRSRRVRSLGEQKSQETFVWKEFCGKQHTGRTKTEVYVLDREQKTYILRASDGGTTHSTKGNRNGAA